MIQNNIDQVDEIINENEQAVRFEADYLPLNKNDLSVENNINNQESFNRKI
jgi:hypothetical protein